MAPQSVNQLWPCDSCKCAMLSCRVRQNYVCLVSVMFVYCVETECVSRSQTVTYTKQRLISRKRCNIETGLLYRSPTERDVWPIELRHRDLYDLVHNNGNISV